MTACHSLKSLCFFSTKQDNENTIVSAETLQILQDRGMTVGDDAWIQGWYVKLWDDDLHM